MRKLFRHLLISSLLVLSLLALLSCSNHTSKAQRQVEKEMLRAEKEADRLYQKELKKHFELQSKSTRKMMKQAKKRAKKLNRSLRRNK